MRLIKATKLQALNFIREKEVIEIGDLASEFGYSPRQAYKKLHRLEKQNLVEKLGARPGMYCLTTEAYRRLNYHGEH